jgi:hypothetical protein
MEQWRLLEELDLMKEWDADSVCDALNITAEELVRDYLSRAIKWIKENNDASV